MIILLILSLVLVFAQILKVQNNWQDSFFKALVLWGFILTIITEILSLFNSLNYVGFVVGWLLVIAFYVFLISKDSWKIYKIYLDNLFTYLLNLSPFIKFILLYVTAIILLIGITAVVGAPNHSDSMEYHLSRVYYWIQHQNLSHYPTRNQFQLYQNPWSAFAITNFQILSNGDRFANTIQWASMVFCVIGVSIITKQLGGNFQAQIIASVFCVTIPMGILQASSTNNDYVVAFWLMCFVYFTLKNCKQGLSTNTTIFLGLSLGLAILTKGSAYIFAFPFCIWLFFWGIKNLKWKTIKPISTVALLILLVNLGHYGRNYFLYNSPLGLAAEGELNQKFGLGVFVTGILKNLSLHADIIRYLHLEKFITPTTGLTNRLIEIVSDFFGLNPSDPLLMNPKVSRFFVSSLSTYEDIAGNPFHLMLILLSLIILIFIWSNKLLIKYGISLLFGFLLFASLFTWSPFRCRLHLPLFILFSPFVGVIFSQFFYKKINYFFILLMLVLSYRWIFLNSVRPLIGDNSIFQTPRIEQYFATQRRYQHFYITETQRIEKNSCQNVGLTFEGTSFEYPLLVLLNQNYPKQIRHINLDNESRILKERYSNVEVEQECIINVDRNKIRR